MLHELLPNSTRTCTSHSRTSRTAPEPTRTVYFDSRTTRTLHEHPECTRTHSRTSRTSPELLPNFSRTYSNWTCYPTVHGNFKHVKNYRVASPNCAELTRVTPNSPELPRTLQSCTPNVHERTRVPVRVRSGEQNRQCDPSITCNKTKRNNIRDSINCKR